MGTKSWAGVEVVCKYDGSPMEYQRDEEHDMGDCEIFKCPVCKRTTHVELPD